MARKADRQRTVESWAGLYRKLLEISERQWLAVQARSDAGQLESALGPSFEEWRQTTEQVAAFERQLQEEMDGKVLSEWFRTHIEPVAREINDNLAKMTERMQARLQETGQTIQSARDHKQASKAYHAMDHDWHGAYFFDEKK